MNGEVEQLNGWMDVCLREVFLIAWGCSNALLLCWICQCRIDDNDNTTTSWLRRFPVWSFSGMLALLLCSAVHLKPTATRLRALCPTYPVECRNMAEPDSFQVIEVAGNRRALRALIGREQSCSKFHRSHWNVCKVCTVFGASVHLESNCLQRAEEPSQPSKARSKRNETPPKVLQAEDGNVCRKLLDVLGELWSIWHYDLKAGQVHRDASKGWDQSACRNYHWLHAS